jgi:SecD/SecF fusion protein
LNTRKRNFIVLGLVAAVLVLAALVIVPGTPLSQQTRLGLDLQGGVELVYQGQPTPQVPKVTPEAIDDAIQTIRKRTDALGVSEPEIQRSGADQISIGLPNVRNAERAEEQVGTTAQLQFYDWEPNVLTNPDQAVFSLFQTAKTASQKTPKAEPTDIPPGGASKKIEEQFGGDEKKIQEYYDRQNDTAGDKYYVFGPPPDHEIIRPGQAEPGRNTNDATAYYDSCNELKLDFEGARARTAAKGKSKGKPAKDTACPATMSGLYDAGVGPPPGSTVIKVPRGIVIIKAEGGGYYVLEDDSELSGSEIRDPKQTTDPQTNEPIVTFEFSDKGRAAFARTTKREAERGAQQLRGPGVPVENTFQRFMIALDNQVVSLATINYQENPEGIDGSTGAQINGIGSLDDTSALAENLRIGALPIQLKLISKTQVSATLGRQALDQGVLAGAAGLLLTLLFLVLFYRVLGLIAGFTLISYALLLFAIVKLIPVTLTLPGIAGLILTLGVAADANIVIFERVKEEARAGRSIPAAIASGYTKALRTIIDANVVTLLVAFILFMLATASVRGFALTLLIGTLVSLFTAVLATQAVMSSMSRTKLLRSRWALRIGSTEKRSRFDFTGASSKFFAMSGLIIAAGAIAISALGINFGIDFTSGTRIATPLERPATVDQVRSALAPLGYGDAKIQAVDDPELGDNVVQISTGTLSPERVSEVQRALDQEFGVEQADFSASSIGPTFGEEIANTAVLAIIASLALITMYLTLRFEFKFAIPVLIALTHDLLITAGVYALFQREVTTSTVAALLTILGYSLYDTIIVFDRIRENLPRMPRATFSQIVNRSMSEVLTRSLVTSLSTLMPIAALMVFGGETLQDFGFALLVGVASGTYSSIFIAAPVLVHWKERESIWRRRSRIVAEDHGGTIPAYADVDLGDADAAAVKTGVAERRERVAARRRAAGTPGTRAPRSGRRPAASAAPVVPPDDGGDGQPDDAVPDSEVKEPQAQAEAAIREAADGEPDDAAPGGGDAADAATSTSGDGDADATAPTTADGGNGAAAGEPRRATRPKQQSRGKRRKHGRR